MVTVFRDVLIPRDAQDLDLFSYPDPLSNITIELNIDFPFNDLKDWTPDPKFVNEIVLIPEVASS